MKATWELSTKEQLPTRITKGPFTLDLLSHKAFLKNNILDLTNTEFRLLYLCMQSEGDVMSYETICHSIWQRNMEKEKNVVQAAIKRFRQKIGAAGYDICAVRGKGYIFIEKV